MSGAWAGNAGEYCVVMTRGAHQREVLAAGGKPEVGVERLSRGRAVLVRGKDDGIFSGRQGLGGQDPLGEISGLVREAPPAQVQRRGRRVVDLDPVRPVTVLVLEPRVVARQELVQDRLLRGQVAGKRAADEQQGEQ